MKNVGPLFPLTHFRAVSAGLRRQDGVDPGEAMHSLLFPILGAMCRNYPSSAIHANH